MAILNASIYIILKITSGLLIKSVACEKVTKHRWLYSRCIHPHSLTINVYAGQKNNCFDSTLHVLLCARWINCLSTYLVTQYKMFPSCLLSHLLLFITFSLTLYTYMVVWVQGSLISFSSLYVFLSFPHIATFLLDSTPSPPCISYVLLYLPHLYVLSHTYLCLIPYTYFI